MSGPSITRRRLFQGTTAAGALGAATLHRARASTTSQPNILLIITDQQSGRTVGPHRLTDCHTPGFDRFISQGVSFTQSYCSDPSCVPGRAGLFTGRASNEHGALINPLPLEDDIADLGTWMSTYSDYDVVYMGKWHIPGRKVTRAFDLQSYYSTAGENCDPALVRAFEGFLQNRSPDAPFLLVLSLYNPHDVVHLVDDFGSGLGVEQYGVPLDLLPELPPNFRFPQGEPALVERLLRSKYHEDFWPRDKWRLYRWWYDRQLEAVDGAIDRVLDLLWNSAFGERTAVLLTSDHGDSLGEHMLANKEALYEAAAQVPMLAAWPGTWAPRGLDDRHLVSGLDIVPTVCELVGIETPDAMRGRSLVPLLDGSATEWRTSLQIQSEVEGRAIRTHTYKYIAYRDDSAEQLFDLRADPWELDNLAEDSAYTSVLEEHRALQEEHEAVLEPTALSLEGYDSAYAEATG